MEHPSHQAHVAMPALLTPHELCWHYAAGCLEARRLRGDIDDVLYERLHAHLLAGTCPTAEDIETAFPLPFERIRAQGTQVTLQRMDEYWRNHTDGETPRVTGIVEQVVVTPDGQQWVRARTEGPESQTRGVTHNHLRYALVVGDVISVHGSVCCPSFDTPERT